MNSQISSYLTYANLQMAAEAMLDKYGFNVAGLERGNDRSSKTPEAVAQQLIADGWSVAAHLPNTSTGLSATLFKRGGECVMSIRSTEFLDDAVRDNKATNELEVKATGFAIGQLADLEKWYQETVKQVTAGGTLTVTGYSLGGHLATAFEQLHRTEVAQVFTFNGAGIGSVKDGYTLAGVVGQFQAMRSPDNDLSHLFNTPALRELYSQLRTRLRDGALVTDQDIAAASALADQVSLHGSRGQVIWKSPQTQNAVLLRDALIRIKEIQDYDTYVRGISDGNLPVPLNKPASVDLANVEATNLNYQLAVLSASAGTRAMSVFDQAWSLTSNYGPRNDLQANIHDITSDTSPSMVANSQYHHGLPTPIFIENQPLARGAALAQFVWQSDFMHADIKLLYPNFSRNDFGDTHSLVLLQDSLSVQDALVKLDPTLDAAVLGALLKAAANTRAQTVPFGQGTADGDTLERAVDGLIRLFVDPNAPLTKAKTEGGTWADIDDRNNYLHAALQRLVKSEAYLAAQGNVRLDVASADLGQRAKSDFAALAGLLAGSTIAIAPTSDAAGQIVELALARTPEWDAAHQHWVGDLALKPHEREAGLANFSDSYLNDRAAYLTGLASANQSNTSLTNVTATVPQPFTAYDTATNMSLTVTGKGLPIGIKFGSARSDTLNGTEAIDHLYGGGGNDKVNGAGGNDRLEGNDGDDRLDGASGADTLLGGWDDDTYVFSGSYGMDVVVDRDDKGSIEVNGSTLGATRSAGNNTWVTKTGSGLLLTLELVADSRSLTGQSLSIHAQTGFDGNAIIVRNFDVQAAQGSEGYLGIHLEKQRALVLTEEGADSPFDTAVAWIFDRDSVQDLQAEASERAGGSFTAHLNQAASAGDTLNIKVEGTEGTLQLIANGEVVEITGEATIQLEEGQTELSFALAGASELDADQDYVVTATWQGIASAVAGQGTQVAEEPVIANAIQLKLKDGGDSDKYYIGDQRAEISDHYYGWSHTQWDTETGELVNGVYEEDFSDVIVAYGTADETDDIQGKGGNDALDGGVGKDVIDGGDGDDLIGGGAGSDWIVGGEGNDVIVSSRSLVVSRQLKDDDPPWAPQGGHDPHASGDTWGAYSPGASNFEIVVLVDGEELDAIAEGSNDADADVVEAGAGNDLVDGGAGDDFLYGEDGDDNLRGLDGDDMLSGGDGADWIAGDGIDKIGYMETVLGDQHGRDILDGGKGKDTLSGGGQDDALSGGADDDELWGDISLLVCDTDGLDGLYHGDDELDGGEGNDKLSGDGGQDTLQGGVGNDTLWGDGAHVASNPIDGAFHGADSLDGGAGNDALFGDGDDDTLAGGEGADRLQGDTVHTDVAFHGDDSLDGGVGDDTLLGDGGNDWLVGGDDTGNDMLWGDSDDIGGEYHGSDTLDGGDGDDQLVGDGDADVLYGGEGNDRLFGDNRTLGGDYHGADLLEGAEGNDSLTGGGADDTLEGGAGGDALWGDDADLAQDFHGADWLDGGDGDDTLQGQGGDDLVFGGDGDDWVAGGDETSTGGDFTMGGDDALFGEAGRDTLVGGLGNDALSGGDGDDALHGGKGDDLLEGGVGSDYMDGGEGNDRYIVDATGLTVGVSEHIADTQGENTLVIRGSASQVEAFGSDLRITFGEGQSLWVEGGLAGAITALEFVGSEEDGGEAAAQSNDATGFAQWLQLNVWEPIALTAAPGTRALHGGSGNDTLNAYTQSIVLNGGWGDDTYYVKAANQQVVEYDHGGIDKVYADVSFTLGAATENLALTSAAATGSAATGNELDNELTGNGLGNRLYGMQGNDKLDGGLGTDTMEGGVGDDTYVFSTSSDGAKELAGEGMDTIRYQGTLTLDRLKYGEVENLVLDGTSSYSGTGNDLNNTITGNSGANTLTGLAGDDTLDGGLGSDVLKGGLGDDTFVLSATTDTVTELAGEGNDTVQFAGTVDLTSTKYANVENATLLEGGAFNLTGTTADNLLIGNADSNELTGNAGKDTLIGGGGEDVLAGGAGDDTYFVDSAGDQVTEVLAEGTDTVLSVISYTLGDTVENLTLLGAVSVDATGNQYGNALTGNDGANVLDGKAGDDTLAGGLGDDTYVIDSPNDTVTEAAEAGTDTIGFAGAVDLNNHANVENLVLGEGGAYSGTGSALANAMTGNSSNNTLSGGGSNDTLDGGAGNDTLAGGLGDDTYVLDNANDTVIELAGEGEDTVRSAATVNLSGSLAAIEHAQLTGDLAINATGNVANNRLTGNSAANTLNGSGGNDTLDGAGGADVLKGGDGDDSYVVDSAADKVNEGAGQGTDTVHTSATLAPLADNVENLTLTGDAANDGTGNDLGNLITGNAANNKLDGRAGADELRGGAGDDTYVLDLVNDRVSENQNEGTDTALVATSWTLADNVENAELTGSGAFTLTGNALDNLLKASGGDDTLIGGAGSDTYELTAAGDVLAEAADGGTADTVRQWFTSTGNLADNVENLVLAGSAKINGTGNALANQLVGNDNANTLSGQEGHDTLAGAGGNDKLVGGQGDDWYIVDSGDNVVEKAGQGVDTVQSEASFTLAAEVERLILAGDAAINGTGNTLNNQLWGNAAANQLDGGAGDDTLAGGGGDDVYTIDSAGDEVVEAAGQGTDTVNSSVSATLDGWSAVENLVLTGTAQDGAGNDLANKITGNAQGNQLDGGAGDDTLDGGLGTDVLRGGAGNDTYVLAAETTGVAQAASWATRWPMRWLEAGEDYALGWRSSAPTSTGLLGSLLQRWRHLLGLPGQAALAAPDTIVESAEGGQDTVEAGVSVSQLMDNVENLVLTGADSLSGTGNGLHNHLTGNAASNTLSGLGGNDTLDGGVGAKDTLLGGEGDDTYVIHSTKDVVTELVGEGLDTVHADITPAKLADNVENLVLVGKGNIGGTGNTLANQLTGNAGNNRLDGGRGADLLRGGMGDDTYVVDDAGDAIIELAGEGLDAIEASIGIDLAGYSQVENVTLTGAGNLDATGSSNANRLTGNTGTNSLYGLAGNDTLDGGAGGLDTLNGGSGDDTYVLRTGSTVVEAVDGGIDTVMSEVTVTLDDRYVNIENVALAGSAAVNATGNAGINTLTGNGAANVLDGGAGNDSMVGGDGDDTYVFSSSNDKAVELAGGGTDTVQVAITANLTSAAFANIENLTLTGTLNLTATGNSGANVLTGNAGANQIGGGDGNDTLIGGGGNDQLFGESGNDDLFDDRGTSDTMQGGSGADIYRIGAASAPGTSRAVQVWGGSDGDVVYLAAGILPEHVTRKAVGTNLVLEIRSPAMDLQTFTVELANQLFVGGASQVDEVRFVSAPDVVWSGAELNAFKQVGTDADEVLRGSDPAPDWLFGQGGNDTLFGYAQDDTLVGGTGNDYLYGSYGNDLYEFGADSGIDLLSDSNAGSGDVARFIDGIAPSDLELFRVSGDYGGGGFTNDSFVLRVVSTGAEVWVREYFGVSSTSTIERFEFGDGTVWTYADILARVNAPATADTLTGTSGNDVFLVDHYRDVINDSNANDADVVRSSISLTLPAYVENLELTGNLALTATGNDRSNRVVGNSGANVIDGGFLPDTLAGGLGDDTYIDRTNSNAYAEFRIDLIEEAAGHGHDLVKTDHAERTLEANLEDMVVQIDAYSIVNDGTDFYYDRAYHGNDLANRIQIDVSDAVRSRVDGGLGADTMIGSSGAQTFVVDNALDAVLDAFAGDADYVETGIAYALGTNIEGLILVGSAAVSGTGNNSSNLLDGSRNSAANQLTGQGGDDVYRLGQGDSAIESVGGGTDTVEVLDESFVVNGVLSLGAFSNIENVTADISSLAAFDLRGNDLNNVLKSAGAASTIEGLGGNDLIDDMSSLGRGSLLGGTGNDTLISHGGEDWLDGGQGDDSYHVGYRVNGRIGGSPMHEGAHIRLGAGSGHDTVEYDGEYVWERYELPHALSEDATYGYRAARVSELDRDQLRANQQISVDLDASVDPTALRFSRDGAELVITLSASDRMVISDYYSATGNELISPVNTLTFGGAFLTGEAMAMAVGLSNFTVPTSGDDLLIAPLGSTTTLSGGLGNDYVAGNALGQRLAGDLGDDTLVAGDGADTLVGGAQDDTLSGGHGADVYEFAAGWGHDTLNEANMLGLSGAGRSTSVVPDGAPNSVYFDSSVAASSIELDWESGEGLRISNAATGDSILVLGDSKTAEGQSYSENQLAYVDQIVFADGTVWDRKYMEWGERWVEGTSGSDNLQDVEADSRVYGLEGDDTLTARFEGTHLYGGGGADRLISTALGGVVLYGDDGNDTLNAGPGGGYLNGGAGADAMTGGGGSDSYVVDNLADSVTEGLDSGYDVVESSVSIASLALNIEQLDLKYGAGAIDGSGNSLSNSIIGNESANRLYGLVGADMLDAGSGDDTLDGGVGYDQLWGGSGSDTYLMRSNYGIDKISEWEDEGGPSNDVVDFGPTLRMADATYFHVGDDLEVHIANSNPNKIDRVVIVDWYWDRSQQVESFVFSDGTLTAAQVEALADGPHLAAVEHESTRFNRCDEDGYRWPRRDRSIGDPGRDRLDWRPSLVAGQLVQAMSTFKMLGEPMGIRLQHLAVGIHQVPFTIPQAFL